MLLALDIGNTNIHVGLWNGTEWGITWRARTIRDKMSDEYAVLLRDFLGGFDAVSGVVIGSVVPPLTGAFVELTHRYLHVEPVVVSARIKTGITVAVDNPDEVGADRIVNTVAVHQLYGGPAIVIDFGTAPPST